MLEYDTLFIGNRWVTPASESVLEVRSPATLALSVDHPTDRPTTWTARVLAARDAFDTGPWPAMSFAERAGYLDRILDVLRPRGSRSSISWCPERAASQCASRRGARLSAARVLLRVGSHPSSGGAPAREARSGGGRDRSPRAGGRRRGDRPVERAGDAGAHEAGHPHSLAGCTLVIKPATETPLCDAKVAEALAPPTCPRAWSASCPVAATSASTSSAIPLSTTCRSPGAPRRDSDRGDCAPAVRRRVNLELGGKSAAILLDDVDLDAR